MVLCAGLAACGPQAGPGDSPEVLATVAGQAITALDLEEYERTLSDYLRSKKEGTAAHGAHLQSLVDRELVLGEAVRRGAGPAPGAGEHPLGHGPTNAPRGYSPGS